MVRQCDGFDGFDGFDGSESIRSFKFQRVRACSSLPSSAVARALDPVGAESPREGSGLRDESRACDKRVRSMRRESGLREVRPATGS